MNTQGTTARADPEAAAGARAFATRAFEAFDRAVSRAGLIERRLRIGGDVVLLRFAGRGMVPAVLPALSHLATDASAGPGLTVCIWDSATTGVPMPAPPWPLDAYQPRGEVLHDEAGGWKCSFHTAGTIFSAFNDERSLAMYWARDSAGLPYYERGAPCRSILHLWNVARGRQLVHAGAAGGPGGCVLLAGRGGSGKSNTALQCLASGLHYLSDDYCLLAPGDPPRALSLYGTAKVATGDLARFPRFAAQASNPDRAGDEKALFFVGRIAPDLLLADAPIAAILLPHVAAGGRSRLTRVSAAEGLMALAPSTAGQLPFAGAEAFRAIAAAVRTVPCYRLTIGAGTTDAPTLVASLLAQGGAHGD